LHSELSEISEAGWSDHSKQKSLRQVIFCARQIAYQQRVYQTLIDKANPWVEWALALAAIVGSQYNRRFVFDFHLLPSKIEQVVPPS
jgi:hypothetical protein